MPTANQATAAHIRWWDSWRQPWPFFTRLYCSSISAHGELFCPAFCKFVRTQLVSSAWFSPRLFVRVHIAAWCCRLWFILPFDVPWIRTLHLCSIGERVTAALPPLSTLQLQLPTPSHVLSCRCGSTPVTPHYTEQRTAASKDCSPYKTRGRVSSAPRCTGRSHQSYNGRCTDFRFKCASSSRFLLSWVRLHAHPLPSATTFFVPVTHLAVFLLNCSEWHRI